MAPKRTNTTATKQSTQTESDENDSDSGSTDAGWDGLFKVSLCKPASTAADGVTGGSDGGQAQTESGASLQHFLN